MIKKSTFSLGRRRLLIGLGLVGLLAAIAAGAYYVRWRHTSANPPSDYLPKASPGQGLVPSSTPSANTGPTPTIAVSATPKASTDSKIVIASPTQGASVKDGSTVSGTANVSSGVLYYRLKGGQSGQLASGQLSITPNQNAAYSFVLGLTNQVSRGGDQGELEIYTLDSSGTATSIASVAVNIGE